jgi:hypothetical protein
MTCFQGGAAIAPGARLRTWWRWGTPGKAVATMHFGSAPDGDVLVAGGGSRLVERRSSPSVTKLWVVPLSLTMGRACRG